MSKGLVSVTDDISTQWASWEGNSDIRIAVIDVDVDTLQFLLLSTENGSKDFQQDFQLIHKYLKPASPALILFRQESKWILVSWIPEDSLVKKKMIFASSRSALKTQLGAPKFDNDFQVSSVAECTYSNYVSKFDEAEKAKTMSHVEVLSQREEKEAFPQELQTEGMKMLNVKVDESAVVGFSAVKNSKSCVFFKLSDDGTTLLAEKPLKDFSIENLGKQLIPEQPCYVIFHYTHINQDSGEEETKILVVYYCSDDAAPKKKMLSASMFKNIGAACAALGIDVAKKMEISLESEFSEKEVLSALYPKAVVKEQFDRPKGPPRKSGRSLRK